MTEVERLICDLYDRRIIQVDTEKGFVLAAHRDNPSLPHSPLYYNLRLKTHSTKPGALERADVRTMARLLCEKIVNENISFDGFAPVPEAGISLADELQGEIYHRPKNQSLPVLLFEKGAGKLLRDRELPRGSTLLAVDDVASDAGSKVPFIRGIRAAGYQVSSCYVFALRNQKAVAALKAIGVNLHWLTTSQETLEILERNGRIAAAVRDEALRQMEALEQA